MLNAFRSLWWWFIFISCKIITNILWIFTILPKIHGTDLNVYWESVCICRLDVYNLKEDAAAFAGKRALISFLSWLDYCDQLIKEAQKVKTIQAKKQNMSKHWVMLKLSVYKLQEHIKGYFCLNQMMTFCSLRSLFCNMFVICSSVTLRRLLRFWPGPWENGSLLP